MALHKLSPLGDQHPIHNWSVADATARLALVVAAADIGKVAAQISDGTFWILQNNTGPVWKNITNAAVGLPTGGTANQVLRKVNGTDYNATWQDTYPSGGSTGQVLGKLSATNQDIGWITASGGGGSSIEAPFVTPPTTGWTSLNSGVITNNVTRQVITGAASGSGANLKGASRALPAASNYTITARIILTRAMKNFQSGGLFLRNSTTGNLVVLDNAINTNVPLYRHSKFTSPTVFSADYLNVTANASAHSWLRMKDDGTNRIMYFSDDGIQWIQLDSRLRTDFTTPDQCGIHIITENAATPNFAPIMQLLSWEATTP